jgi:tetratricopeptide (TPR) repeat protein
MRFAVGLLWAAAAPGADLPCATCHPALAESYARTAMARSFRAVKSPLPEFRGQMLQHAPSEQFFLPLILAGKPYLRRYQKAPDGATINVLEKSADYVVGSGNHSRTYLHRAPSGKLIELPVSWYSEKGGYWHMSPAYDRPDHAGFSREITYRCMFCHNAYPEIPPRADVWDGAVYMGPLPEGIDCQRCHGSGAAHVKAAQEGKPAGTIVNPARLSRERQTEVCMQCHLETTSSHLPAIRLRQGRAVFSYRPGEPLEDYALHFDHAPGTGHDGKFEIVNAAYGMRKSACFLKSATLTCTTCHDPHGQPRNYARVCQGCHGSAHSEKAMPECVSCHMERRRPADVIHVEMTDHQIRRRPLGAPPPAVEVNTFNTPPYRGEVVLYYPPAAPNELEVALAQVADGSNLQQGLARLERLGTAPPFDLGQAWLRAGDAPRALPYFEEAVRRSPDSWRDRYAAAMAGSANAVEHLERARALAPREAVVLVALASLQPKNALPLLRRAIELDPDLAESHNNLGSALMKAGDLAGAQAAYGEAIRLRPEVAAFHVNIATLFTQLRNLPKAQYHLQQVLRIEPGSGITHLGLGEILLQQSRIAEAREHFQMAAKSPDPELRAAAEKLLATLPRTP